MLLKIFADEDILAAAEKIFSNRYIQIMKSDIYLENTKAGRYRAPWLEHEFYVSTDFAYKDSLVNGNQTRYKVSMSCILVKDSPYDIVYDTKNIYYVVFEDDGELKFEKYIDFVPTLTSTLELLEEIQSV